jgi:hypothetical protein
MTYKAPEVAEDKITPQFVRDQLLLCFESANREFARILDQNPSDNQLREQVFNFVKNVFSSCGVSFDNPTKEGIMKAIQECRANAEKMMGTKGKEIIEHHYREMMKLVEKMK